jgi:hypothetical protein
VQALAFFVIHTVLDVRPVLTVPGVLLVLRTV